MIHTLASFAIASLALTSTLAAQFNDPWAQFVEDASLISSPSAISDANHETDMAWGDLDKDGLTDVVIVRSIPFINVGKRSNVLLMNENGVLVDRTAVFAAQSDVGGDSGFLTATQDRDVVLADVDGDSWLDVITATDQPAGGDAKSLAHPRIYRNLGEDGGGNWLGLRHEDARIPQLLTIPGGVAINPRFMTVSAADVNDDTFVDLYFGDMDYVGVFVDEPLGDDTQDRLLINDGSGFFTDATLSSMTGAMVISKFCNSSTMTDFNLDGYPDRLKQTSHDAPNSAHMAYNDPLTPGVFASTVRIYNGSPYYVSSGDLNNDGRPDVVISDNGTDKFLFNLSTDVNNEVVWAAPKTYEFLSGSDDGFAANNLVADLDGDGWRDVFYADVDPEIPGYTRRLHIYHNRGGTVGGTDIVMREERRSANNAEWTGVVGMTQTDMRGTHDVAVLDVDDDGLLDILLSRLAGTVVWRQVEPWTDLGCALAGMAGEPVLTGSGTLQPGDLCSIDLSLAAPSATAVLFASVVETPTPFKGGILKTVPILLELPLVTLPDGTVPLPFVWPSGFNPLTLYLQYAILDPAAINGVSLSNALRGEAF